MSDWQDRHKASMMHKYKKVLKKETGGIDVAKLYNETSSNTNNQGKSLADKDDNVPKTSASKGKKTSAFHRAQQRLEEQKRLKNEAEMTFQKKREEREAKLKAYKEKKDKRSNVIKAKNKKGQPLMGGRIELLLEKIQNSMQ